MRDDFSAATKALLAKRVGYVCSNPDCRQPTSGPQEDPSGSVNIGVAAHISAASPGGARYDGSLSSEQRSDFSNGIWLCQTCAKLIDNDPERFAVPVLESWKRSAENAAAMVLSQGRNANSGISQQKRAKIERLMPKLLREMQEDLHTSPTAREFVILNSKWIYNSNEPYLAYHIDEHEDLNGKLDILVNLGFVTEITYNNVRRFRMQEELVDYLMGV